MAAARGPHRRVSHVGGISGVAAPAPSLLRPVSHGRALRIPFSWAGESQPPQSVSGLIGRSARRRRLREEELMDRTKLSMTLLALLVASTAAAQVTTNGPRRFTLPDHGQFVIAVPAD